MTMITPCRIGCGACGAPLNTHRVLSTHNLGSPDLDFRPPPEQRGLLDLGVQACEYCGYCASELACAPTAAQALRLQQPGYRQRLTDPLLTVTACRYRAAAELLQAGGDLLGQARMLLAAAWACDDATEEQAQSALRWSAGQPAHNDTTEADAPFFDLEDGGPILPSPHPPEARAAALRRAAAQAFEHALGGGRDHGADGPDDAWAIGVLQSVDALRRGGAFSAAARAAADLLRLPVSRLSPRIADAWDDALRAQLRLAQARDAGRRTLQQALDLRPDRVWVAAARASRNARQLRAAAEAAVQAQAQFDLEVTPEGCLDRIAQLLRERPGGGLRPGDVQELPMPSGVSDELLRLAVDERWLLDRLVAGIALGLIAAMPALGRRHAVAVPVWRQQVHGHQRMVRHLEHVFRRCRPGSWHYWPPAGPRVFEG